MKRKNMAQFIKDVANETGQHRQEVEKTVWATLEVLARTMANRETLSVSNFGRFEARERAARNARNPQTGETVRIPATTVPYFHPTGRLLDIVNEGDTDTTFRKPVSARNTKA